MKDILVRRSPGRVYIFFNEGVYRKVNVDEVGEIGYDCEFDGGLTGVNTERIEFGEIIAYYNPTRQGDDVVDGCVERIVNYIESSKL